MARQPNNGKIADPTIS